MRIAFTSIGTGWESKIDPRFGRTDYFILYDNLTNVLSYIDNRDISKEAHGAGPKTAQRFFELKADVLITGNGPGGNASTVLEKAGTEIYIGAGNLTVNEAYNAYKNNELKKL